VATVRHADRVRLRYRLQGLSDDWIEVQGQRETTIPTLPHGDYVFTLASSLDGSQWVEGEPLFLTIQPHLWQTRWAQSLAVLLGVLGVLGFVRGRTHALQRRQAEMQRLVDERTEELRLANEHLSRLSYDDALTGLPNRRRFDEQFALEWRRLAREGTPLALILADVDHFKAYNDTLGHAEGDLALREVAEIFRRHTGRAGDFAARYGGEEFVVLLPGFNAEAAALYAERLRVACEAHGWPHPSSPTSRVLTLTLGVACLVPGLNETPEQLFAQADAALYRAKAEGRNRIRTAFPLEAPTP
jgi:diguanylate cyclase (GGDEF)-like protein